MWDPAHPDQINLWNDSEWTSCNDVNLAPVRMTRLEILRDGGNSSSMLSCSSQSYIIATEEATAKWGRMRNYHHHSSESTHQLNSWKNDMHWGTATDWGHIRGCVPVRGECGGRTVTLALFKLIYHHSARLVRIGGLNSCLMKRSRTWKSRDTRTSSAETWLAIVARRNNFLLVYGWDYLCSPPKDAAI